MNIFLNLKGLTICMISEYIRKINVSEQEKNYDLIMKLIS